MKRQITSFSPLQTAKVFGVLYFAISLPFLLLMLLPMLATAGPKPPFLSGFMLAMPFLYALIGFLFTLFGAWVYNIVAARVGGIEYTTSDVDED
jgi:hypothetical protein